jgi:D-serine deaminase-like pyridoxal phosphate-dependent protein
MQDLYHYYRSVFAGLPRPFAFVDRDNLQTNIQDIIQRAAPAAIRVATKSIRCLDIIKHILHSSPAFIGAMTYSAAETVWLSRKGLDNLLIGYPQTDETILEAVAAEIKSGKTITCMVDSPAQASLLNKAGLKQNVIIPVCIDVDMSVDYPGLHFGVWRSSLTNEKDLHSLVEKIISMPNIRITGLMGYEAQVAGIGDNMPGGNVKNAIVKMLKKDAVIKVAERRQAVVSTLKELGIQPAFVNGGGTGSIESTKKEKAVTEITVGSGFFQSHLFDNFSNFKHKPAAAFGLEISRTPSPHIYTCHGGGYTASGAAGKEKLPLPYLPGGMKLLSPEGAGEVQTPFKYNGSERLNIGDTVFFRHAKAGELCERFNFLYIVSDGKIIDKYPTYRGEGQSFL